MTTRRALRGATPTTASSKTLQTIRWDSNMRASHEQICLDAQLKKYTSREKFKLSIYLYIKYLFESS